MASQPPELPESIVLGQFAGLRNTLSRERLMKDELERAINVDIDDSGQVRRRRGRTLAAAGNYHSVKNVGSRVLGVKDGVLGVVNPDYSFTSLGTPGGAERLSYTAVGDLVFYSSMDVSGKILDDTVLPWGVTGDAGEWVSPVITPTETLGAVFGKHISAPPMASLIEAYKGRIYLAAGRYLWATELFLFDYVDRTRNFLQFESDITMLVAMGDGLFVGTETDTWFLKGTLSDGFDRANVTTHGVLRGSDVLVPTTHVHPGARDQRMPEGIGVVFMTTKGVFAGFDGGETYDLTLGRVLFPAAVSAAALYREDSGVNSYVAVTDSAGGPTANARIGDYADAEIVRRGG